MENRIKHPKPELKKISENIYRICYSYGNQTLFSYILKDKDEVVLVDPGSISHCEQSLTLIDPALSKKNISLIILQNPKCDIFTTAEEFSHTEIASHRKTYRTLLRSGSNNRFFDVDEKKEYRMKSGRTLFFYPVPFLPNPGSIMTWDKESGVLFSGNVFGAVNFDKTQSSKKYTEAMIEYHKEFFPSGRFLTPVMDQLARMKISKIAPLFGKLIDKNIESYIQPLQNLIFEQEPMDLSINRQSRETSEALKKNLLQIEEEMTLEPLTKLYNQRFFQEYLHRQLMKQKRLDGKLMAVLYISIDNLVSINKKYGRNIGDETIKGLGYILRNFSSGKDESVYKLNAPVFTYCFNSIAMDEFKSKSDEIRELVRNSDFFTEKITVSMGGVLEKELTETENINYAIKQLDRIARMRLQIAEEHGDTLCMQNIDSEMSKLNKKVILLIEPDDSYSFILKSRLEFEGFHFVIIKDGKEAFKTAPGLRPDCIISELMLPKFSAFHFKKSLNNDSELKKIPFILVSHRKDDDMIRRASSLGITYYLKKPFSYFEIEGLVKNLTRRGGK